MDTACHKMTDHMILYSIHSKNIQIESRLGTPFYQNSTLFLLAGITLLFDDKMLLKSCSLGHSLNAYFWVYIILI